MSVMLRVYAPECAKACKHRPETSQCTPFSPYSQVHGGVRLWSYRVIGHGLMECCRGPRGIGVLWVTDWWDPIMSGGHGVKESWSHRATGPSMTGVYSTQDYGSWAAVRHGIKRV